MNTFFSQTTTYQEESPLVSAVIATYNDARYLPTAVESVLGQEYKPLECIIVDDGSNDGTTEIVKRWIGDSRFHYMRTNHIGLSNARNLGIRAANGEFIAFLDADDWWEPEKTHRQVDFLLTDPELSSCWCDVRKVKPFKKQGEIIIGELHDHICLPEQILLIGTPDPPPVGS